MIEQVKMIENKGLKQDRQFYSCFAYKSTYNTKALATFGYVVDGSKDFLYRELNVHIEEDGINRAVLIGKLAIDFKTYLQTLHEIQQDYPGCEITVVLLHPEIKSALNFYFKESLYITIYEPLMEVIREYSHVIDSLYYIPLKPSRKIVYPEAMLYQILIYKKLYPRRKNIKMFYARENENGNLQILRNINYRRKV